ncbi:hypothetical protein RI030_17865 [Aphanizomenon flos-aquae NRERC-008]|uniref:Superfamily II DNA and RNA helicase n=1 Tax=Aphanizomenon flos-aquae FACHB-1249 TaxID=2692889 RepID=A0ABR8IMF3_APHFL|nr:MULTISPECIES: hypothetical protein [Aphanizomenon]MBD2389644.1 hypothetical protein [Aphanizomenon flos-aquae FACHB-1171]MBD2556665.1 hypothetical protein [Aphanizomenon flos-aquae FACHB-1290]MBD2630664.1 hypothetical protein [Aphanizomenon sp. FACHB-1399]MBD2641571.1 hypothetical protein [Aphanizomenon sp. FACHB-1401]MBD2656813.1 hypothetical protein [Aphanizomenon flos-aquae FACHB-1265]
MIMTMLRKFTVVCLALTLCLTTVACGGENQANSVKPDVSKTATPIKLNDGQYQVQQGTYNDANGEYTLFLLNNNPPSFATEKLQMARLTEEEIKAGKKTYLKVENGQPALYLTEDFKLEYVHNVTETKTNPQTGQKETVIVRQESNFWTPFAASLAGNVAGQAIGSMLFRPQYYVPPVYQPGGVMTGYGGYGSSYDSAVSNYRSRYNEPPAAVRNRTTFRTTGNIRNSASERATTNNNPTGRASGSGFGGSNLRPSDNSSSTHRNSGSSFGSGGRSSSRRSSGFGSRRR